MPGRGGDGADRRRIAPSRGADVLDGRRPPGGRAAARPRWKPSGEWRYGMHVYANFQYVDLSSFSRIFSKLSDFEKHQIDQLII